MDRYSNLLTEIELRENQLADEDTPGHVFYIQCRELIATVQNQEITDRLFWTEFDVKVAVGMGVITIEEAFTKLSQLGFSSTLIDDEFGNWAVVIDKFKESLPKPGEPGNLKTLVKVNKEDWKKTIHEAFVHALQKT